MTQLPYVRTGSAPPLGSAHGAIRWICTNNPFYVLSAGLFLAGLWISFGDQHAEEKIQPEETWALMSWLAAYHLPEVLTPNPRFDVVSQAFQTGLVARPSDVTGAKYQDVTDAYIKAVHSVLTGEQRAPAAAAALERELVRITGFKTGPPR